jgi:hypothetical protein
MLGLTRHSIVENTIPPKRTSLEKRTKESRIQLDISKCNRRDGKLNRRKDGMRISGKSIFVLEEQKKKKAEKIKQERLQKERMQTDEPI